MHAPAPQLGELGFGHPVSPGRRLEALCGCRVMQLPCVRLALKGRNRETAINYVPTPGCQNTDGMGCLLLKISCKPIRQAVIQFTAATCILWTRN
jgi:hypothetical protein